MPVTSRLPSADTSSHSAMAPNNANKRRTKVDERKPLEEQQKRLAKEQIDILMNMSKIQAWISILGEYFLSDIAQTTNQQLTKPQPHPHESRLNPFPQYPQSSTPHAEDYPPSLSMQSTQGDDTVPDLSPPLEEDWTHARTPPLQLHDLKSCDLSLEVDFLTGPATPTQQLPRHESQPSHTYQQNHQTSSQHAEQNNWNDSLFLIDGHYYNL